MKKILFMEIFKSDYIMPDGMSLRVAIWLSVSTIIIMEICFPLIFENFINTFAKIN